MTSILNCHCFHPSIFFITCWMHNWVGNVSYSIIKQAHLLKWKQFNQINLYMRIKKVTWLSALDSLDCFLTQTTRMHAHSGEYTRKCLNPVALCPSYWRLWRFRSLQHTGWKSCFICKGLMQYSNYAHTVSLIYNFGWKHSYSCVCLHSLKLETIEKLYSYHTWWEWAFMIQYWWNLAFVEPDSMRGAMKLGLTICILPLNLSWT